MVALRLDPEVFDTEDVLYEREHAVPGASQAGPKLHDFRFSRLVPSLVPTHTISSPRLASFDKLAAADIRAPPIGPLRRDTNR